MEDKIEDANTSWKYELHQNEA